MLTLFAYLIWLNQSAERTTDEHSSELVWLFWGTVFLWPLGGAAIAEQYLDETDHKTFLSLLPLILGIVIFVLFGFAVYLVAGFVIGIATLVASLILLARESSKDETP